jgi:hypothetical protein
MARANKLIDQANSLRASFGAMPRLLKLITLNAVFGVALVAASVAVPFDVYGRKVPATEWWSSGAGPVLALAMVPGFASAWLMLRRSPLARKLYLSSFALLSLTGPLIAHLAGADATDAIPGLVLCLLLIPLLGSYLYLSRDVQDYFRPTERT